MSAGITTPQLNGPRKAAILLAMLGEDSATHLLGQLSQSQIERVARELANMGSVPQEVALGVLEEYEQIMGEQAGGAFGGKDVANRLLVKALGESAAQPLLEKLDGAKPEPTGPAEIFSRADTQQLARLLEGEHPQAIALVLGHMDSRHASALLMRLPQQARIECVKRLANLRHISPEMTARISSVLDRRLQSKSEHARTTYSGHKSVAELLNRLDGATAREILSVIEQDEPDLAVGIRDSMFVFEDFLQVPELQIRELMSATDKKTLTLALKTASEELKSHFYRTMSSRAIEMLKEDSEALGPVRGKEVARAQLEMVAVARKLEAEGRLTLRSDGEDQYVV